MTTTRKNLTQPDDWWELFARQAKREGLTLSEWMGKHCRSKVPANERMQLSDRPPANRPKKTARNG